MLRDPIVTILARDMRLKVLDEALMMLWVPLVMMLAPVMPLYLQAPGTPPPSGDHGVFDRFALPGGGEFDHEVGYGGGTHWPTSVCTVIFACIPDRFRWQWTKSPKHTGHSLPRGGAVWPFPASAPGWGFRIHLTPPPPHTAVKSSPSPPCTLGHAIGSCITRLKIFSTILDQDVVSATIVTILTRDMRLREQFWPRGVAGAACHDIGARGMQSKNVSTISRVNNVNHISCQ